MSRVSISGRSETVQPTIKKTIQVKKVNPVMLRGFVVPIIIILIWQLVGTFFEIPKTVLPTPLDILQTFQALIGFR